MDLIKFIKSLEELLYEVATWLLFYPRTLWIAFTRPATLDRYTGAELTERVEVQFTDVVSPPMFLLLTLLIVHVFEMLTPDAPSQESSRVARRILESDTNVLIFRSVAFSIFPVLMANGLLRRLQVRVDRETLRMPFYIQCFFVAPFVILTSVGTNLVRTQAVGVEQVGIAIVVAGFAWYVAVQAKWFASRLGVGLMRGAGIALKLLCTGLVLVLGVLVLIALPDIRAALASGT